MKKRQPKRPSQGKRPGAGAVSASGRRARPEPEAGPRRERARPAELPARATGEAASIQLGSEQRPAARRVLPIVGIGASAGGLEALEGFLRHVPSRSGMAFVVVQHLDPTHKGAVVELLQRDDRMPVAQVNDRTKVEPDHVYVIPPNKDMSDAARRAAPSAADVAARP